MGKESDDNGAAKCGNLATRPEHRRVRRWSAAVLAATGVVSLISATTLPLRHRIADLQKVFPLAVPEVATVLVAFSGLALILLSRGIRRGQAVFCPQRLACPCDRSFM